MQTGNDIIAKHGTNRMELDSNYNVAASIFFSFHDLAPINYMVTDVEVAAGAKGMFIKGQTVDANSNFDGTFLLRTDLSGDIIWARR